MIIAKPGTKIKIYLDVKNIVSLNGEPLTFVENPKVYSVTVENCERGYSYTTDLRCEWCPRKYYLTIAPRQQTDCIDCPSDAICFGGWKIAPKDKYWRKSLDSIEFVKCINPNSCL
jgi:hypothetical protein